MLIIIKYIEKILVWGIMLVMSIILLLAFIDIIYEIKVKMLSAPFFIINSEELMDLFSLFLVLLIGLELLETVKTYLKEDIIHVELIILVAIIAISRKVIVWDFSKYSSQEFIGLSLMILALGVTYFLIKKAGLEVKFRNKKDDVKTPD